MTLRATIEELIAAWQTNDALRASAFFAPDGTYVESGGEPVVGREAIGAHFQRFFRDGPLWRIAVDEIIVDGESAAVAYRFSLKGVGSEWRERQGCALVQRRDGMIASWREYQA